MAPPIFVWMDLEMTGLDPETCAIVEIGVIVTGPDLVPIAKVEHAVWQPEEVLLRMEPFVRAMHTDNGLLDRIRASRCSLRDAERDVMALLAKHVPYREGILAGNSIHTDRAFLVRHMPIVESYLHYRQLDVTSLKILAKGWYPQMTPLEKGATKSHTAIADLEASLAELAHYRQHIFK